MSHEDKRRLRSEADSEGLTVQQLLEKRVLGAAKPIGASGRPVKNQHQAEELPIAG